MRLTVSQPTGERQSPASWAINAAGVTNTSGAHGKRLTASQPLGEHQNPVCAKAGARHGLQQLSQLDRGKGLPGTAQGWFLCPPAPRLGRWRPPPDCAPSGVRPASAGHQRRPPAAAGLQGQVRPRRRGRVPCRRSTAPPRAGRPRSSCHGRRAAGAVSQWPRRQRGPRPLRLSCAWGAAPLSRLPGRGGPRPREAPRG